MRSVTVTYLDGRTVTVELDPRSTLHVTGRTRAASGSPVGGRSGVQVELRDVEAISLDTQPTTGEGT